MRVPQELKPAAWGAIAGAVALWIVGFSWGGWTTSATASAQAKSQSDKAVVLALAPICVDRFKQSTDAPANLVELKKASTWQRGDFIVKGGWAKMPGATAADPTVASACAELLTT